MYISFPTPTPIPTPIYLQGHDDRVVLLHGVGGEGAVGGEDVGGDVVFEWLPVKEGAHSKLC